MIFAVVKRGAAVAVATAVISTTLGACGHEEEAAAPSSLTSIPTSTQRAMSSSTTSSVSSAASSSSMSSSSVARIKAETPFSDGDGEPVADGEPLSPVEQGSDSAAVDDAAHDDAQASATGGGVELRANKARGLSDGERVTVQLSGLNPQAGYYLAVCGPGRVGPAPVCVGGHGPQGIQHWLSNTVRPGSIPDDGTLTTTVEVPKNARAATGQMLNCEAEQCTIKLFGDPAAGFRDIVDLPVNFA